jgi:DNA-binding MarR family transcriptional regulator
MPLDSSPASAALHKFLLIHRHLRQHARTMDSQGIGPRQFAVLRFLAEDGPATIGAIQDHMYTSASTASTIVSQLDEAGYLSRTRSDEDNRVVIVALTPAGEQVVENTRMGGIALLRRKLTTLPEDRVRRIDAALADIMELMEVSDSE